MFNYGKQLPIINLIFPFYYIDSFSGQLQIGTDGQTFSGWKPADDVTRQMLRDGGWSEFSSTGTLNENMQVLFL